MNTRLSKIRALLLDQRLDAILISSPSNLYYLSGFVCLAPYEEQEALLLVTKTHAFLLTSPLYHYPAQPGITPKIAPPGMHFTKTCKDLIKEYNCKTIGIEEQYLSVAQYQDMLEPDITFFPVALRTLRIQKEKAEITAIEKACATSDKAFSHILSYIKMGISEEALATELEIFIRKENATLSFPSIIAFGPNSATPHHVSGKTLARKTECVLLDFGVKVDNYCSDMTRTVFVGTPPDTWKKVYTTVQQAQDASITFVQERIRKRMPLLAKDIDQQAREIVMQEGFSDFPHCSHGIGLQVHEAPSLSKYSKDSMTEGMVFSIEPGIYLQNEMGVRIEDLMVIEDGSAKLLTKAPKDLIIL